MKRQWDNATMVDQSWIESTRNILTEYRIIKSGKGFPPPVKRIQGTPWMSICKLGRKWNPGEKKERNRWNQEARLDNYLPKITA